MTYRITPCNMWSIKINIWLIKINVRGSLRISRPLTVRYLRGRMKINLCKFCLLPAFLRLWQAIFIQFFCKPTGLFYDVCYRAPCAMACA